MHRLNKTRRDSQCGVDDRHILDQRRTMCIGCDLITEFTLILVDPPLSRPASVVPYHISVSTDRANRPAGAKRRDHQPGTTDTAKTVTHRIKVHWISALSRETTLLVIVENQSFPASDLAQCDTGLVWTK
jgi:hypothetical protein